jgi:hypothetical protein
MASLTIAGDTLRGSNLSRMNAKALVFESKVWVWSGTQSWFFATLPQDMSDEIKELTQGLTNGFGSVRVDARIGDTFWRTSIFPDSKIGAFMLPLKAEVRKKNNLVEGSATTIELELVDF